MELIYIILAATLIGILLGLIWGIKKILQLERKIEIILNQIEAEEETIEKELEPKKKIHKK